jgi:hypothetical protein
MSQFYGSDDGVPDGGMPSGAGGAGGSKGPTIEEVD